MKRLLSLMLTALIAFSSFNLAFAAEVPTVTIGDFDATAVEVGGDVVVPVSIDKFPEGKLRLVSFEITFDKSMLEFAGVDIWGLGEDDVAMQVWNATATQSSRHKLEDATWSAEPEAINADNGAILFTDTTSGYKKSFLAEKSLVECNTFVYLYFKKLAGATGSSDISFRNIILNDVAVDPDGIAYTYERNEVKGEAGTVTFTSGPKDVKKVVGYYTGDKLAENDNADTTDTTAAVYAELNGDANTNYKKVNWTVTVDETEGKYTQAVDVTGEATYKFGLVIRGLAADVIDAVDAALAQ